MLPWTLVAACTLPNPYYRGAHTDRSDASVAPDAPRSEPDTPIVQTGDAAPVAAEPRISVARASVTVGEQIVVSFADAPGNPTDWVGVYLRSQRPSPQNPLISQVWAYLGAPAGPSVPPAEYQPHRVPAAGVKAGTVVLREGSQNPVTIWPLQPGSYTVHLFFNDDHQSRAAATFDVSP